MVYILLGGLGFLIGYLLEATPLQRLRWAKAPLWIASGSLIVSSLVLVSLQGSRFWLPAWLPFFGGGLLPFAAFLLVYSLFIELPFHRTYVSGGPGPYVMSTGTYALVRHPTVLWYGLVLVSLVLITQSQTLLIALPIWLTLDVLWAVLQERFSLPQSFPHYDRYRKATPMLIPTLHSILTCLANFRSSTGAESVDTGR